MIKAAITPDNSDVSIAYIDRADTTVPLIASNKGTRPAVIGTKALLEIQFANQNGPPRIHTLVLTATNNSRENLLIPAATSKQFFYAVDFNQTFTNPFQELSESLKQFESLQDCTIVVNHQDFLGNEQQHRIVIFSREDPNWIMDKEGGLDSRQALSALECIGKIPQPIRQRYKLLND